jgi:hypothetical protein
VVQARRLAPLSERRGVKSVRRSFVKKKELVRCNNSSVSREMVTINCVGNTKITTRWTEGDDGPDIHSRMDCKL